MSSSPILVASGSGGGRRGRGTLMLWWWHGTISLFVCLNFVPHVVQIFSETTILFFVLLLIVGLLHGSGTRNTAARPRRGGG
jgi:hypothetical protein